MGLPGKPKGFDGGVVERYFREGKITEIADYCGPIWHQENRPQASSLTM
jgi:hypothetical protein